MCWRFTVTVPPHCAKGAGWWAESTAAVQSQTRWWFALGWWVLGYPSFSILQLQSLSLPADKKTKHHPSLVDSPPALLSDRLFQVTPQPRHLYAVGRTILTASCSQACWEVVSFWLVCMKILIQKKKIGRNINSICCTKPGQNTMSCCAYSPSQSAGQTPRSHLWGQATPLRRQKNTEYY